MKKLLERLFGRKEPNERAETGSVVSQAQAESQCRISECYGHVTGVYNATQFFLTFFQDNQEAQQEVRRKMAQDLKQSKNTLGGHPAAHEVDNLLPFFDLERGTELLRQRQQTRH